MILRGCRTTLKFFSIYICTDGSSGGGLNVCVRPEGESMSEKVKLLVGEVDVASKNVLRKGIPQDIFDVVFVDNGMQVLDYYNSWQPDIMAISEELQFFSVNTLLKSVRNKKRDSTTKIVVFFDEKTTELKHDLEYLDIQGALAKPLKAEKIRSFFLKLVDEKLQGKLGTIGVAALKKQKLKLLIAEDMQPVVALYDKYIRDDVFTKRIVDTGTKALEIYKVWKPDLILLDLKMPEMDGLQVLRAIRNEMGDTTTPIVVATVSKDREVIDSCLGLNVQGYLIKPFDLKTLHQKLLHYCSVS